MRNISHSCKKRDSYAALRSVSKGQIHDDAMRGKWKLKEKSMESENH